jgi:metal-responsive CopG/Arc/MetJ family transcriptional regulator
MPSNRSKTISLTLPELLLAQIDQLAKRDYSTRSGIIRRATMKYVRESDLDESKPKPQRDYGELAKKYPHIDPNDRQLLAFLDDFDNDRL